MQARRSLVWVVVALAVLGLAWWLVRGSPADAAPEAPPHANEVRELVASAQPSADDSGARELASSDAAANAAREAVALDPAASSAVPDATRCRVTGRLVDSNGAPCADVRLELVRSSPWPGGDDALVFEVPRPAHGYATTSDDEGRFGFDVPTPEPVACRLVATPRPHLEQLTITFGPRSQHGQVELNGGTRDVGDLTLASCGQVLGRVVATDGAPLTGVHVRLENHVARQPSHSAKTDALGRFAVAHVVAGTYSLDARLAGMRAGSIGTVVVEAVRDTDVGTIELAPASTIEGHVVDTSGVAVAGAKVVASSVENLSPSPEVRTDAEGRFVIALFEDSAHYVVVQADGFVQFGDYFDENCVYSSGARDVEIVVEALTKMRFVVIDAATREPIENYGLVVLANEGSASASTSMDPSLSVPPENHPQGVHDAYAQARRDALVVRAPGYVPFSADVGPDAEGGTLQTIALTRSGALRGRVWVDGEVRANADVRLERGHLTTTTDDELGGQGSYDLANRSGHWFRSYGFPPETTVTDDEGRFVFEPIEWSMYRVSVDVGEGRAIVPALLLYEPGTDVDLGDLAAVASGAIEGRVLVAPGVDPSGLFARLDLEHRTEVTSVDGTGRFTFTDVEPGWHQVTIADRAPDVVGVAGLVVDVPVNGVIDVELDARAAATCSVEVRFAVEGGDVRGWQVWLVGERAGANTALGGLGSVDDTLGAHGAVSASRRAWAAMRSPFGVVALDDQTFELPAGGSVSIELSLVFGTLAVRRPNDLELPAVTTHRVEFARSGRASDERSLVCTWVERDGTIAAESDFAVVDGAVELSLPVGKYDAAWSVLDAAFEGDFGEPAPRLHERTASFTVAAGERTVVQFP